LIKRYLFDKIDKISCYCNIIIKTKVEYLFKNQRKPLCYWIIDWL